jgi:hypothetical protein
MKLTEFKKLIREEARAIVREKRLTTAKNALERTVDQIMDPLVAKAVEDANNALLLAMKELDSKLKGKTVSVPGQWKGTVISVLPVLTSNRSQGMKRTVSVMKSASPGLKIKVTDVQEPGYYNAKVGKIINMDYLSWLNADVELL